MVRTRYLTPSAAVCAVAEILSLTTWRHWLRDRTIRYWQWHKFEVRSFNYFGAVST